MKTRAVSLGLLVLRIGIGIAFMIHGFPKIIGGIEKWEEIGSTMSNFGVTVYPAVFGFLAAFAEFVGGLFFVLGLFFRITSILLCGTMLVATTYLFTQNAEYAVYSHPLKMAIVFLSTMLIGAGNYSLDYRFFDSKKVTVQTTVQTK